MENSEFNGASFFVLFATLQWIVVRTEANMASESHVVGMDVSKEKLRAATYSCDSMRERVVNLAVIWKHSILPQNRCRE